MALEFKTQNYEILIRTLWRMMRDWAKISLENGHFIFAFLVGVGDKFKISLDLHKERHMEAFLGSNVLLFPNYQTFL